MAWSSLKNEEIAYFAQTAKVCCMEAHPVWHFQPATVRPLNLIKLEYGAGRTDGRLNLTASTFNQLGQYTSRPGCRGYHYAELTVFFPCSGCNHRQYSLRLPTAGWPGWVDLGGWLHSKMVHLSMPILIRLNTEQLCWLRLMHFGHAKYANCHCEDYYSSI